MNFEQQKRLFEWQKRNFDNAELWKMSKADLISLINKMQMVMGMAEEVGEVAHALLKHSERIRDYVDKSPLDDIIDGVIDSQIYGTQLLSSFGVNVEKATENVIESVTNRDWKKYPGGENF